MKQRGFTIIELLIVIVVIAILVSITIVAYNGVQKRAYDAVARADAGKLGKLMQLYQASTGLLPGSAGGSTSIASILSDSKTMGSFTFSSLANYKSMNSVDPHAGLVLYYQNSSSNVSYICFAVMPVSGVPVYFSTTKGVFQPALTGSASTGYDFVANCSDASYGASPTYGRFQLESYV